MNTRSSRLAFRILRFKQFCKYYNYNYTFENDQDQVNVTKNVNVASGGMLAPIKQEEEDKQSYHSFTTPKVLVLNRKEVSFFLSDMVRRYRSSFEERDIITHIIRELVQDSNIVIFQSNIFNVINDSQRYEGCHPSVKQFLSKILMDSRWDAILCNKHLSVDGIHLVMIRDMKRPSAQRLVNEALKKNVRGLIVTTAAHFATTMKCDDDESLPKTCVSGARIDFS